MKWIRTVDKYVFLEAGGLFVLGFSAFLAFLLINKLFLEADKLLDPSQPGKAIAMVTLLEAPNFMTWSLPIGILFATLMSMGRLAKDNELTAFFTNGISLYRLFMPYLVLSCIAVIIAYFTQENLVTLAAAQQQKIIDANPVIRQDENSEADPFITRLDSGQFLAATSFDEDSGALNNVVYDSWSENEGELLVTSRVGSVNKAILNLGVNLATPAHVFDHFTTDPKIIGDAESAKLYDSYINEPTYKSNIGLALADQYTQIKTPQELTQTDLAEQSRIKKARGENVAQEMTDYHMRYSGPFASLAFALVAMPLSLRAPRDERLLGLIISFVLVLIYYTIYFLAKLMGYNEVVPPWLAAWAMNIVFAFIAFGIFLFSRK
ncbi:MAG: LptF/LptG family permease [Planctomycetales bacterium]|nr:LptF/LptG family permease [bacterium]UNM08380.1 MAG: LptF/LptG family permease [Planctomycetales bacterium]